MGYQTWDTEFNLALSGNSKILLADFWSTKLLGGHFLSKDSEFEDTRGWYAVAPSGSPKTQSSTFRYFDRKTSRS